VNKEKILALPPGTDLNIKVAEEIFGHAVINDEILGWMERPQRAEDGSIWSELLHYSEDLETADLIVKLMLEAGYDEAIHWDEFGGGKYSKPEAICKAALLALMDKRHVKSVSDRILREALGDEEDTPGT
jgi:hypothetical protein